MIRKEDEYVLIFEGLPYKTATMIDKMDIANAEMVVHIPTGKCIKNRYGTSYDIKICEHESLEYNKQLNVEKEIYKDCIENYKRSYTQPQILTAVAICLMIAVSVLFMILFVRYREVSARLDKYIADTVPAMNYFYNETNPKQISTWFVASGIKMTKQGDAEYIYDAELGMLEAGDVKWRLGKRYLKSELEKQGKGAINEPK